MGLETRNTDEHGPDGCVVCEIVAGREPVALIEKDDQKGVIAFMSKEGHPLVCPTKHGNTLGDELDAVFSFARQLIPVVEAVYGVKGITLVANIGEEADQDFEHFHLHLIPRSRGDRKIATNLISDVKLDERKVIAKNLREELKRPR